MHVTISHFYVNKRKDRSKFIQNMIHFIITCVCTAIYKYICTALWYQNTVYYMKNTKREESLRCHLKFQQIHTRLKTPSCFICTSVYSFSYVFPANMSPWSQCWFNLRPSSTTLALNIALGNVTSFLGNGILNNSSKSSIRTSCKCLFSNLTNRSIFYTHGSCGSR